LVQHMVVVGQNCGRLPEKPQWLNGLVAYTIPNIRNINEVQQHQMQ